ncbi:XdhC family protein [Streptomyces swartbergensis]|uniref:XdhC family protein n=1 Tax=Streptomyces swartbergensis TaxID=487165 RepID=UPI001180AFAA
MESVRAGTPVAVATVLSHPRPEAVGTHVALRADDHYGSLRPPHTPPDLMDDARALLRNGDSALLSYDTEDIRIFVLLTSTRVLGSVWVEYREEAMSAASVPRRGSVIRRVRRLPGSPLCLVRGGSVGLPRRGPSTYTNTEVRYAVHDSTHPEWHLRHGVLHPLARLAVGDGRPGGRRQRL